MVPFSRKHSNSIGVKVRYEYPAICACGQQPVLANAPAPTAPALSGALLVSKTPGSGDQALPEAGTNLPLYGVLGMLLLAMGAVLMFWRKPVRS